MPQSRIVVRIEGQQEQEVDEFNFQVHCPSDNAGRPAKEARTRALSFLVWENGENKGTAEWGVNKRGDAYNFRSGMIEFFDHTGVQYQSLEWEDGFVEEATWVLPDRDEEEAGRLHLKYRVSARVVRIGGVEVDNKWKALPV